MKFLRLAFPLIVVFINLSCGPIQQSKSNLQEAVLAFNEGVRWGRLQEVLPRIHPDSVDHFVEMHKEFGDDIKVSDYEILNANHDDKNKKADVSVRISWYRESEMVVRKTMLVQHWEEHGQDWIMLAEEYVSGDKF